MKKIVWRGTLFVLLASLMLAFAGCPDCGCYSEYEDVPTKPRWEYAYNDDDSPLAEKINNIVVAGIPDDSIDFTCRFVVAEAGTQHKKSYKTQSLIFTGNADKKYGAFMDINKVGFELNDGTKMYKFDWSVENGVFTVTFCKKSEEPAGDE